MKLIDTSILYYRDSEYVGHTQCVTELERYSAKGFTPKPNSQKGLTKQILWNDMINEVLKHKNLGVSESRLLQSICMLPNIPRKQSKFQVSSLTLFNIVSRLLDLSNLAR